MSNTGDGDSRNSPFRQSPLDALLQCLDDEEFLEEDEDDAKLPSTPSTTQAPPQPSPSPSTQQPQQSIRPTRAMERPHRPLNAYNIFFQATRQQMVDILRAKGVRSSKELKELKQKIGFQNLAKTVSNRWKSISEAEKAIYHQRADVERARYYKQMNEWYRINNQDDEEQKEVKVKEKAPQGSAPNDAQEGTSRTAPQPHAWMGTASTSASEAVNSHAGPNNNVSYFGAATRPTTNQGTIPRSLIHGIGPMSLGAFSQTIQNPSADSSVLQDALLSPRPSDTITNQAEPLRTPTATTVLAPAGLLPSPIQPLGRHTVEQPHHFEEFKQMDLSSASTTATTTTATTAPAFVSQMHHVHHGLTQQQQQQNEQKTSLSQTLPQTQQRQPLPQTQPNTQPHTHHHQQQQQNVWLHDTPEDARMRLLASRLGPDAVNFVVDAFGPEPQQQPTDGSNNDSRLANFPLDRLGPSDSW